ncbi:MAG: serpin family protein [Deltaproteobacteria bacterium]|nr:serpin family protein [Deltaproteobacteria bacterium]
MRNITKAVTLSAVLTIILFTSQVFAGGLLDEEICAKDNSAFAVDLYQKLCESDGNIFFSPYSISTALAMTYAGARGNTEKQMAKTLKFSLGQKKLHAAFAVIESSLKALSKAGDVKLSVANSLWPQSGYKFLDAYTSQIKKHYGVIITPVNYKSAPKAARKTINKWVEEKTQAKIKNLIPPNLLDSLTRLVLVNAIYFKGNWKSQFEASQTKDAPFYVTAKKTVQAPTMSQKHKFGYAETKSLQVLELPYLGSDLSMILLLPKKTDGLKQLESDLTVENLKSWTGRLREKKVKVFLPKFKMTSMFDLSKTLKAMGMPDAFNRSKADFSGMDGKPAWLYIAAVLHKAFVEVNEKGTEAAAATAVVMKGRSKAAAPPTFRADHPFIFLITEIRTGSILFMGRVTDPTKTGE